MRPQFTSLTDHKTRRNVLVGAGALLVAGATWKFFPVSAQTTSPDGYEIMDAQAAFDAVSADEIVLVDIRRPDEWSGTGIGEGAVALDMREESFVASLVELRKLYPTRPIALICRTGNRSGNVVSTLAAQGFPGLVDVSEGMVGGRNGQGWIKRGLPTYVGTAAEITPRLNAVMTP
ncbi:MAG: rhodanese-like domain-containing protein [Paracoccaceae bacterium]